MGLQPSCLHANASNTCVQKPITFVPQIAKLFLCSHVWKSPRPSLGLKLPRSASTHFEIEFVRPTLDAHGVFRALVSAVLVIGPAVDLVLHISLLFVISTPVTIYKYTTQRCVLRSNGFTYFSFAVGELCVTVW